MCAYIRISPSFLHKREHATYTVLHLAFSKCWCDLGGGRQMPNWSVKVRWWGRGCTENGAASLRFIFEKLYQHGTEKSGDPWWLVAP